MSKRNHRATRTQEYSTEGAGAILCVSDGGVVGYKNRTVYSQHRVLFIIAVNVYSDTQSV